MSAGASQRWGGAASPESELADTVRLQLRLLGEDPSRDGLLNTPQRVARSLEWLTSGSRQEPAEVLGDALFESTHEGLVVVRDIEFYSLCEHHVLPFFGKVHVGYVPHGRIVGLSKLPRIVEVFSRRLQVQERLTDQIADSLDELVRPRGVGVVVEASHLCVMMRGVEKQGAYTTTSALRGDVRDCASLRDQFLRAAGAHGP